MAKPSKYLRLTKFFDTQYGSLGTVRNQTGQDGTEYNTLTRLFRLVGAALMIPQDILLKALTFAGKAEGIKYDGVLFNVRQMDNGDRVLSATPAEPYTGAKASSGNVWGDAPAAPKTQPQQPAPAAPPSADEVPF